jgi:hypothetical protein
VEAALAHKLGAAEKPFLWIVDDLASGLGADAVRAWLAPHPLGKTLLTTRSREYGAIGRALPLDVLEPAEAYALLTAARQPDNPDEEAAARSIAGDVGYHPLALAVAAASLDAQAGLRSFADFRAALADHAKDELELAADLADMLPTGHEKSVASTLLRSVRALPPEGMDFLRLASLLAVAPIPPTLVAAVFANVDDLGEAEAAHRAALAFKQAERASLSERSERGARTAHALVSRAVRFHDADPARREQFRVAIVAALKAALPKVADIRLHEELALEVMHARTLCVQGFEDVEMARLALWVAHYDFARGAYSTARALQEEVLQVSRRVLGAEHPNTLTAMSNLAQSLSAQGDMAGARALEEEVLQVRRRVLGAQHPNTLTAMNNLAHSLRAQGEVAGARALQEEVLQVRRRVLGAEHPNTSIAAWNLFMTLRETEHASAERVLKSDLHWLLERDPSTLLADQRKICDMLRDVLKK